jgi:hypothetical protein
MAAFKSAFRPQFPAIKNKKPVGELFFNWEVDLLYLSFGELSFFCQYTLPVLRGFGEGRIAWKEIFKIKHCHGVNVLHVQDVRRKCFINACNRARIEPDAFFQIPGKASSAHRIIGYRKNGTFYLVYDDKDHSLLQTAG